MGRGGRERMRVWNYACVFLCVCMCVCKGVRVSKRASVPMCDPVQVLALLAIHFLSRKKTIEFVYLHEQ